MSNRYKLMCGCIDCPKIQYYQSDYNQYKKLLMNHMQHKRDMQMIGTRGWSLLNDQLVLYKNEIRNDPRPKDAVRRVQCHPTDKYDSDLDNIIHIDCAYGVCKRCPKFEIPFKDKTLTEDDPLIFFHAYEQVTSCGMHLDLSSGETECLTCATRRAGEPNGRLTKKTQLVLLNTPFQNVFENYYLPCLLKYRMHRFLYIILSKNHTGRDRRNVNVG